VELYLYSPNTPSWRGSQVKEQRDNFNSDAYAVTWIATLDVNDRTNKTGGRREYLSVIALNTGIKTIRRGYNIRKNA
jgi:hypothetical protein